MKRQRGLTLIELLLTGTIGLTFMGAMVYGVNSMFGSENFVSTSTTVGQNARQMAMTVADALRDSTICTSSDSANSPCTWTGGPIQSPTSSSVIAYTRLSSGAEENQKFYVSGNTFKIDTTTGSGTGTTTTESLYTGTSVTLSLVYYQASSGATTASSLTSFTPTSSTSSTIVGAGVTATITNGEVTGTYTTTVKFRNCPAQSVSLN